jgi:hypothetical protein
MTQDRSPLVGVADNGRVLVILDGGWAASRSSAGAWSRGIKFSADALMESFAPATAAAASDLIKDARAVLR